MFVAASMCVWICIVICGFGSLCCLFNYIVLKWHVSLLFVCLLLLVVASLCLLLLLFEIDLAMNIYLLFWLASFVYCDVLPSFVLYVVLFCWLCVCCYVPTGPDYAIFLCWVLFVLLCFVLLFAYSLCLNWCGYLLFACGLLSDFMLLFCCFFPLRCSIINCACLLLALFMLIVIRCHDVGFACCFVFLACCRLLGIRWPGLVF